jgi:hypothetical protein
VLQIGSSASTLSLVFVSGSDFQADWIELTRITAVEASSWDAVKQLYRYDREPVTP